MARVPTAVWRIAPEVVLALDARMGEPTDMYVNGSQTWVENNGPGGCVLEWRLHPVKGFVRPEGLGTYELWENVVDALRAGNDPAALPLGAESRALGSLWDGLECFPAYQDDPEPSALAAAAVDALGEQPDRIGLVDHEQIGDAWEKSGGKISAIDLVFGQLEQLEPE
jgi:hypothetical protein